MILIKLNRERKQIYKLIFVFDRIQCGDSRIQKYFLHCLGCWWARQNQASMETLLYKHTGTVQSIKLKHSMPSFDKTLLFCGAALTGYLAIVLETGTCTV